MISFTCKNCGRKFNVSEINAGKKGKCPKCKNIIVVPEAEAAHPTIKQRECTDLKINSSNSAYDSTFLDVPEKDRISSEQTSQYSDSNRTIEGKRELEQEPAAEEAEPSGKRKLPWVIDILLYPASVSGIIHLVIFLFLPPLVWVLLRLPPAGFFIFVALAVGIYLLFVGYMLCYIGFCVVDSAKGGRRAPDITTQDLPDKGDLVSQLFLILGAVAVCFWPVGLYSVLSKNSGLVFWMLSACGIFFLPMALLAGILFDATHALNPAFIIASIRRVFLPYCGLVPLFCVLGGLLAVIASNIFNLPSTQTLEQGIGHIMLVLNHLFGVTLTYPGMAFIYLAMVAAHLLGSFYWWHKDELDWGV